MAIIKCKMCGGSLEVKDGLTICECEYCGTKQTLPKTDNEQNLNLFNRANHFRQQCEFDRAAEIYEKMANNTSADAELYWSMVLCRYGIEYVDDPITKKKIPTCHRTQFRSILNDPDYQAALEYADVTQRSVYEEEATYIDNVQKSILEISNKEQPFDVFICYKETDENGKRTQDSVLAQELYYGLTQEGFKVFFSRITLESKLGREYEPYIFAALNSSKVMVVVGTKPEYFNAVWVHNEWSRYLMLMQNDKERTLIPAYKDMNPYDLPDALSMFQAQDMSKLGFMQDLVRGIRKILNTDKDDISIKNRSHQQADIKGSRGINVENYIKRGYLCLEDEKWNDAVNFFEQVLNEDVEEYRAYIGKLCAEMNVSNENDLVKLQKDFTKSDNYRKACRFGGKEIEKRLFEYNQQGLYEHAISRFNSIKNVEQCIEVQKLFSALGDYADSRKIVEKCKNKELQIRYDTAQNTMNLATSEKSFIMAQKQFEQLGEFLDASHKAQECFEKAEIIRKEKIYNNAISLCINDNIADIKSGIEILENISDYKDASQKIEEYNKKIIEIEIANKAKQAKQEAEKRAAEEAKRAAQEKIYNDALILSNSNIITDLESAIIKLESISSYKDSSEIIAFCKHKIKEIEDIAQARREASRRDAEKRKEVAKKQTKITLVTCGLFALLIIGIIIGRSMYKLSRYNKAVSLLSNGDYEDAINIFNDINNFKDSNDKINECKYKKALSLLSNDKYDEAINEFSNICGYKDSIIQIIECNYQKAYSLYKESHYDEAISLFSSSDLYNYKDSQSFLSFCKLNIAEKGDIVVFGQYEWHIIEKSNDYLTLLCKNEVTKMAYNTNKGDNTWEQCSLRQWLNDDFYNQFTDIEKDHISITKCKNNNNIEYGTSGGNDTEDYIFLLSYDEYNKIESPTQKNVEYSMQWWLRSPGANQFLAMTIDNTYKPNTKGWSVNKDFIVRPALTIKLKSD
ncbi:TIR domain-containing protein [Ruminococcus flavefaciens]|uniref:TIR domain-containing protein n=1 Tax=Ruminococcus flavefaciens TaxID=1265 RepID=A0A1H6LP93_RUMFL|nr:DUF6273 domain-containing protein [Ruminococcus flavefaciens]SEH86745.1 TIR domain-containing protein [Ruminococcus flavefaciens]